MVVALTSLVGGGVPFLMADGRLLLFAHHCDLSKCDGHWMTHAQRRRRLRGAHQWPTAEPKSAVGHSISAGRAGPAAAEGLVKVRLSARSSPSPGLPD